MVLDKLFLKYGEVRDGNEELWDFTYEDRLVGSPSFSFVAFPIVSARTTIYGGHATADMLCRFSVEVAVVRFLGAVTLCADESFSGRFCFPPSTEYSKVFEKAFLLSLLLRCFVVFIFASRYTSPSSNASFTG